MKTQPKWQINQRTQLGVRKVTPQKTKTRKRAKLEVGDAEEDVATPRNLDEAGDEERLKHEAGVNLLGQVGPDDRGNFNLNRMLKKIQPIMKNNWW